MYSAKSIHEGILGQKLTSRLLFELFHTNFKKKTLIFIKFQIAKLILKLLRCWHN